MTYSADYSAIIMKNITLIREFLKKEDVPLCLRALGACRLNRFIEAKEMLSSVEESKLSENERQYYLETLLLIAYHEDNDKEIWSITERTIGEFPDSYFANYFYGYLLKSTKKWIDALACFEKCIQVTPENENLYFNAISIAVILKRKDKINQYKSHIKSFSNKFAVFVGSNLAVLVLLCVLSVGIMVLSGQIHFLCAFPFFGIFFVGLLRSRVYNNLLYMKIFETLSIVTFSYFMVLLVFSLINSLS